MPRWMTGSKTVPKDFEAYPRADVTQTAPSYYPRSDPITSQLSRIFKKNYGEDRRPLTLLSDQSLPVRVVC
jgi:hypothetical protein